jgi:hypothetical protein
MWNHVDDSCSTIINQNQAPNLALPLVKTTFLFQALPFVVGTVIPIRERCHARETKNPAGG